MLLRRITEHLRTENWFAVVLDLVVVVVGIFLAFQVDRWYEDRRMQALENDRIVALIAEFSRNRADLEYNISLHQQVIDSVMALLALGDRNSEAVSHDDFYTLLAGVNFNPTFQAARGTYDVLTSTGEIDLIQDPDIRRRLAEFYTESARAENRDRQIMQRVTAFEPYIKKALDHNALMRKVHPTETKQMDPALSEDQFRQVIGTPEFESEIGDKWHTSHDIQSEQKGLLELAIEIQRELQEASSIAESREQ